MAYLGTDDKPLRDPILNKIDDDCGYYFVVT